MDWNIINSIASIAGGVVAGVMSAHIVVRHAVRRDRKEHDSRITTLIHDMQRAITTEMRSEHKELHGRISALRDDTYRDIVAQIGSLEGRMAGVDNIMRTLLDRYMGARDA